MTRARLLGDESEWGGVGGGRWGGGGGGAGGRGGGGQGEETRAACAEGVREVNPKLLVQKYKY